MPTDRRTNNRAGRRRHEEQPFAGMSARCQLGVVAGVCKSASRRLGRAEGERGGSNGWAMGVVDRASDSRATSTSGQLQECGGSWSSNEGSTGPGPTGSKPNSPRRYSERMAPARRRSFSCRVSRVTPIFCPTTIQVFCVTASKRILFLL